MNTIRLSLFTLGLALAGCSFAARSPDMYRDDTRAVLETKNEQIKGCYDELLKTNKDAQGKVTVKFTVAKDTGAFSNVAADPAGTTAPAELTTCVTTALDGLVLSPGDKSEGQATFVYEFTAGAPVAAEPAPPTG
jgi:hypothetical protein